MRDFDGGIEGIKSEEPEVISEMEKHTKIGLSPKTQYRSTLKNK